MTCNLRHPVGVRHTVWHHDNIYFFGVSVCIVSSTHIILRQYMFAGCIWHYDSIRWLHCYDNNLLSVGSFLVAQPIGMGWLRFLGSLKFKVSFAKEPYKRDYILQKRPLILRSLLIVATPYKNPLSYSDKRWHPTNVSRCIKPNRFVFEFLVPFGLTMISMMISRKRVELIRFFLLQDHLYSFSYPENVYFVLCFIFLHQKSGEDRLAKCGEGRRQKEKSISEPFYLRRQNMCRGIWVGSGPRALLPAYANIYLNAWVPFACTNLHMYVWVYIAYTNIPMYICFILTHAHCCLHLRIWICMLSPFAYSIYICMCESILHTRIYPCTYDSFRPPRTAAYIYEYKYVCWVFLHVRIYMYMCESISHIRIYPCTYDSVWPTRTAACIYAYKYVCISLFAFTNVHLYVWVYIAYTNIPVNLFYSHPRTLLPAYTNINMYV